MPEATFRHGDPLYIDYTAAEDIDAGEIITHSNSSGLTTLIAHLPIENGAFGAMAAGGGVYDIKVASNYAAGTVVYWDDGNSVATSAAAGNGLIGTTVEAAAAANDVIKVHHWPYIQS